MMEYKGYIGVAEFDADEDVFHGRVVNLSRDGVNFVGRTVDELKQAFIDSVDDYLAFCEERGEAPERPFSGKFVVRVSPELHRSVATAAARSRKSMNRWIADALEEAAHFAER